MYTNSRGAAQKRAIDLEKIEDAGLEGFWWLNKGLYRASRAIVCCTYRCNILEYFCALINLYKRSSWLIASLLEVQLDGDVDFEFDLRTEQNHPTRVMTTHIQ